MHLLRRVESYLKRSGTPPTRFGRDAVRDPRLVFDLRDGREPGPEMIGRISDYLETLERELER